MKQILEGWLGERVQLMVKQGLGFEGKLEEVGDEIAIIHQESGVYSAVKLSELTAVHRIPSVTLSRPQLEIVGPPKKVN